VIGVDTTFLVQLEIIELPLHANAHATLNREVIAAGAELALSPQVLTEFIHVTDNRRFAKPLSMNQAISRARFWWNAVEVRHVFPTASSTDLCLDWIGRHNLGRKRLLDTQLASTLWSHGVRRLLTSNANDFAIFGFDILSP
jgi:predicted nucleic acid-binding protein